MCVCVRACVRACVRVCVYVSVYLWGGGEAVGGGGGQLILTYNQENPSICNLEKIKSLYMISITTYQPLLRLRNKTKQKTYLFHSNGLTKITIAELFKQN